MQDRKKNITQEYIELTGIKEKKKLGRKISENKVHFVGGYMQVGQKKLLMIWQYKIIRKIVS